MQLKWWLCTCALCRRCVEEPKKRKIRKIRFRDFDFGRACTERERDFLYLLSLTRSIWKFGLGSTRTEIKTDRVSIFKCSGCNWFGLTRSDRPPNGSSKMRRKKEKKRKEKVLFNLTAWKSLSVSLDRREISELPVDQATLEIKMKLCRGTRGVEWWRLITYICCTSSQSKWVAQSPTKADVAEAKNNFNFNFFD